MKTELFISDVHIPHHDRAAEAVAFKIAKHIKPNIVTFGGDIIDMEGVSFHLHPPQAELKLYDEVMKAKEWIGRWRQAFPRAEMHFLDGNHEHRLTRFLHQYAPALSTFPELSTLKLLDLAAQRIKYYADGKRFRIGKLWHAHGDQFRIGMGCVNPSVQLFRKYYNNIIVGHFHRICSHFQTVLEDTYGVWINGCLQDLHPDFDKEANWQHGVTIIHYTSGGFFHVNQIPIIQGKAVYGGTLFKA